MSSALTILAHISVCPHHQGAQPGFAGCMRRLPQGRPWLVRVAGLARSCPKRVMMDKAQLPSATPPRAAAGSQTRLDTKRGTFDLQRDVVDAASGMANAQVYASLPRRSSAALLRVLEVHCNTTIQDNSV